MIRNPGDKPMYAVTFQTIIGQGWKPIVESIKGVIAVKDGHDKTDPLVCLWKIEQIESQTILQDYLEGKPSYRLVDPQIVKYSQFKRIWPVWAKTIGVDWDAIDKSIRVRAIQDEVDKRISEIDDLEIHLECLAIKMEAR